MPHNPRWEDYQRVNIAYSRALHKGNLGELPRPFPDLDDNFSAIRDTFPQTDRERAFHRVADAAELIDLKLPVATEEQGQAIIDEAHRLLDEAIELDEHCYDAMRMNTFAEFSIYDDTLSFLEELAPEVKAWCKEQAQAAENEVTPELAPLAREIEMGPYLRWVTTQSTLSLVCGRNKQCLHYAQIAFDEDPLDVSDVRFSAALAYAKLEDEAGLESLAKRQRTSPFMRPADDPWMVIARMCIAFKQYDMQTARVILSQLISRYDQSIEILYRQTEFPDGVFARLHVGPYTPDELALAVSEATVLFQESMDFDDVGVISSWIRNEIAQKVSARELMRLNALTFPDYFDEGEIIDFGRGGGMS